MKLALASLIFTVLVLAASAQTAKVSHVSDGDSFILASGERVRMIGINAPELADKFGPEAKEHLSKLIRNKTVTLEGDPENDDRDVHGRLLRFVTLKGTDINRRMIADGYAYAFLRYRFSRERRDAYRAAEEEAKAARVGIWAATNNQKRPEHDERDKTPTVQEPVAEPAFSSSFIAIAALALLILLAATGLLFLKR